MPRVQVSTSLSGMDTMSDMNSVEHQGLMPYEPSKTCTECGVSFDSDKSLEVHQRYHHENLMNHWIPKQQPSENNNNNCKPEKRLESADSSEPKKELLPAQSNSNYVYNMYPEPGYYMENSNENYMMGHHYSPQNDDHVPSNGVQSFQQRYHPYHRPNSVSSASPRSPLHCDKCGALFEDANLLAEHTRTSHPTSPNNGPASTCPGYLPQQRYPAPSPQMPLQSPDHGFDYQNQMIKPEPKHQGYPDVRSGYQEPPKEIKQEPEEQAELLDLDSHKVQTHRFDEINRMPSNHPEMHMIRQQQLQQQQQQQRMAAHSVSWSEYTSSMQNMGSMMENPSSMSEAYMRPQQHLLEPGRLAGSPVISSTQPIVGHQMMASNTKTAVANQSWKSNEARRPKTYQCSACNKWFTSSGHLKRHYNTTLHKNAVKQSNQPDPANMPISAHHHPGREPAQGSASAGRGNGARQSPDQSSSQSPPNLMAGPSGEATGGLFQQPMSTALLYPSNGISNERECTPPQQPMASSMLLAPLSSPVVSSMTAQHPLGDTPQLAQLSSVVAQHSMSSPMSPHLASPTPMAGHMSTPHDSSMPISSPPGAQMAISQQYPNGLPPHVISSSNLVEYTSNHIITTGSDLQMDRHYDQSEFYSLPGFKTLTQQSQKYYTMNGAYVQQQVNNVGGLSPEDAYDPDNHILKVATPYQYPSSTQGNQEEVDENVNRHAQPRPIKPKKPRRKLAEKDTQVVTSSNNNSIRMQNGMHKCEECDKFFNKACYLTQHNKSFHAGEKPFKCTVCGKRFIDEPAFQEHMAKHTGDKPYKCKFDVCTKQFNHKTDLRRHMCAHTGHKPYSCDICAKSFIRKDHMVKHYETHKKRNYQNNNNNNVSNSNKMAVMKQ